MDDTLNQTFCKSRQAAHRQVEGQTIIILPQTEDVVVLNETGAEVWNLSDGVRTAAAVAEAVAMQFHIPLEVAQADVAALYRQLVEAGVALAAE